MHAQLSEFVGASKKLLKELPQLKSDYQFFVKHLNRKSYQIEFLRCDDEKCDHCQSLPARNNELLDLVRKFGGSFPSPVMGFQNDHYRSLEEVIKINNAQTSTSKPVISTSHGCCQHDGCNYGFFSLADIDRHNKLMDHPPRKRKCKSTYNGSKKSKKSKKSTN